MVTASYTNASRPQNIALLVTSALLLPAFALWARRQARRGGPALIPNAVWRNPPFLFVCVAMFLTWAAFNAFQYTTTLFLWDVQGAPALQASLHFLPMAAAGVLANAAAARLVARVDVHVLLGTSAVAPLLMAVASPEWSYWTAELVAIVLSPINGMVMVSGPHLPQTTHLGAIPSTPLEIPMLGVLERDQRQS